MRSLTIFKRPLMLVLVFLFLIILHQTFSIQKTTVKQTLPSSKPFVNINIFDLNQPLEPDKTYAPIQCRSSAKLYVETVLCVHDLEKDIWVSGSIWRDGVWERWVLTPFLDYVNKYPDWLVLDIGAQVGKIKILYSESLLSMGLNKCCRFQKASSVYFQLKWVGK